MRCTEVMFTSLRSVPQISQPYGITESQRNASTHLAPNLDKQDLWTILLPTDLPLFLLVLDLILLFLLSSAFVPDMTLHRDIRIFAGKSGDGGRA
jgi:hypothetical protein